MADDAAVLENHNARADLLHDFENVGAEDDDLAVVGDRANERLQDPRRADVESGERLVKDDDPRVVKYSGGDQHLLPHPFRVRRQRLVPVVVDVEQLKETIDLVVERSLGHAAETADEPQVFGPRQI